MAVLYAENLMMGICLECWWYPNLPDSVELHQRFKSVHHLRVVPVGCFCLMTGRSKISELSLTSEKSFLKRCGPLGGAASSKLFLIYEEEDISVYPVYILDIIRHSILRDCSRPRRSDSHREEILT